MSTKIIRFVFAVAFCCLIFLPLVLYLGFVIANIGTDTPPMLDDVGTCHFDGVGYVFSDDSIFASVSMMHPAPDTAFGGYTTALYGFTSTFGCSDYLSFVVWYISTALLLCSIITLLVSIPMFAIKIIERYI